MAERLLQVDKFGDLIKEPRIDAGHLVDLFDRIAALEREADVVETFGVRRDEALGDQFGIERLAPPKTCPFPGCANLCRALA